MRVSCFWGNFGPGPKMSKYDRLTVQAKIDADYFSQWHKTFAWLPVEVAPGDCRWLETVERKFPRYSYFVMKDGTFWTNGPYVRVFEYTPEFREYNDPEDRYAF